jgi:hypothetical protein
MRTLRNLILTATVAATALLAPVAHAQGADLRGRWMDPTGTYMITVGEGVAVNPPAGGGGGAWYEYTAYATFPDGSRLTIADEEGNSHAIDFTITAYLHGNAAIGFQVEFTYQIGVDNQAVDRGQGHLTLSSDGHRLTGTWTSSVSGDTGSFGLVR